MKNHFEHLRFPGTKTTKSFKTEKQEYLYNTDEERIYFVLGKDDEGKYAYGYNMKLQNGQYCEKEPNMESGYFSSEREAKIFFFGNMQCFPNLFSKELLTNISYQINELLKLNLFA